MVVGGHATDLGSKDEPVGFERDAWVGHAVIGMVVLFVAAALIWFLK